MQKLGDYVSSSRNIIVYASATALGVAVAYQLWRRYKLRIPGDFVHVGQVKKIIIYPIKSLPGIEIDSAYLTKTGLRYGSVLDRSFLLQKEESGLMMSMRQEPSLALLKLSLQDDIICIDGKGMETLKVKIKTNVEQGDIVKTCRLFGQDVNGIDRGDEVSQWFQKYLGKPGFRLIQFVPNFKPRKVINNILNQFNPGSMLYHDDSTYLIMSEASIDDLNQRLEEKVTYKNFRPNFLLSGCEAYAEDNMKFAKVGDAVLLLTTQCPRCILTTVNPETGIKTEKEPLTTLRTYRLARTEAEKKQYAKAPLFGVYMGLRTEGKLFLGDSVSGIPV